MSNSSVSKFTSLCLKTIGIILIVSFFIDCLTIPLAFQPLEPQWQIRTIGEFVDRGIIPMVGMAFVVVSFWAESNTNKSTGSPLRLPVFLLSLFLGFMFLIFVPLYLNNLRLTSNNAQLQIEQKAGEAENRISEQYDQLNAISTDPQRLELLENQIQELNNSIGSGKFRGQDLNPQQLQNLQETRQQLQNFRELAKNPEELEQRLTELQTQLRDQKLERESEAKSRVFKQGLRTGLSSFLLAIGYLVMGWFGLQGNKGNKTQGANPKASASR